MSNRIFSWDTYAQYIPSRDQIKLAADKVNSISATTSLVTAVTMAMTLVPVAMCITPGFSVPIAIFAGSYKEEIKAFMQRPTVVKAIHVFFKFQKIGAATLAASASIYCLSGLIRHECQRAEEKKSFYTYYGNLWEKSQKKKS